MPNIRCENWIPSKYWLNSIFKVKITKRIMLTKLYTQYGCTSVSNVKQLICKHEFFIENFIFAHIFFSTPKTAHFHRRQKLFRLAKRRIYFFIVILFRHFFLYETASRFLCHNRCAQECSVVDDDDDDEVMCLCVWLHEERTAKVHTGQRSK